MVDVKIKCTVSATITLSNIPEDVFRDICRYIEEKTVNLDRAAAESAKAVSVISEPVSEKKPRRTTKTKKFEEYANMQKDPRLQKISALYNDYDKNPDRYTLVEMTAADYISKNDFVSGVDIRSVGKRLATLEKSHPSVTVGHKNKYLGVNEKGGRIVARTYFIPVLKDCLALRIRQGRIENGLTVAELSELIGYDKAVITNWENGVFTPSSEAKDILKKVFGSDVFDGINS